LKKAGIRVNCICPDFTETPLVINAMEDKTFAAVVNMKKSIGQDLISPELVADGMIQLIEDEEQAGAVLRVNYSKGIHYKLYPKL
jgi:NAD(P)-dependent dehydrogenase (short-subunit alcohol dehydrogenase family)